MNIVYSGDKALMMEQSIGVMSGMAMRKVSCAMKKPRKEAAAIFAKSARLTFSRGMKADNSQNKRPAPMLRRQNKAIGESR